MTDEVEVEQAENGAAPVEFAEIPEGFTAITIVLDKTPNGGRAIKDISCAGEVGDESVVFWLKQAIRVLNARFGHDRL